MTFTWGIFWCDWMFGVRLCYYSMLVKEIALGLGPLHISIGNRLRYIPTMAVIAKAMNSDEGRAALRDVGLEPKR